MSGAPACRTRSDVNGMINKGRRRRRPFVLRFVDG
jgi:hypothetical protein